MFLQSINQHTDHHSLSIDGQAGDDTDEQHQRPDEVPNLQTFGRPHPPLLV